MLSQCDNDQCKNCVVTEYYEESNTIAEQYPCEDCKILISLDKKHNGNYAWTYNDKNEIIDITHEVFDVINKRIIIK